ncbi:hypothetical protein [Grimontia hollisae]|uniref:hypothetical protein n=1 Tax=Grimontia hollisae TaxID=673 RepID=UPI000E047D54|nr:hypothetical protein [Grimontia hollisae]STQ77009.1 Uncharacterised protein [Grimontia hollisae]
MQKRRFYRLDEINDVTSITKGDLLHAVESGKLALCAWVDAKALGAQIQSKDPNRPALANIFDYRGVLSLTSKQSIDCLSSLKTAISRTLILEPEFVSNWRSASTDYPKAKSVRFSSVTTLPDKPLDPFVAFASIGTQAVYGQRAKQLAKAGADEWKKEGFSGLFDALLDTDEELATKPLEIRIDQLRFDLESVNKVFGLQTANNAPQSPKIVNVEGIETHPIKIMISAVLAGNREANARTIWNAIKRDHQTDAKQIDVDSLISTMNNDEIEWFGQKNAVRITKYKTFQNLIAEVRKSQN